MNWSREHELLRSLGVELATGLSDAELASAEGRVGCRFPADLRSFLQAALPRAEGMPDWRTPSELGVPDWREWAGQALEFDLEHTPWWWPPPWGPRPVALQDAIRVGHEQLRQVPPLIPIWGHRFLPAEPEEAGNPVLSVWQMVDSIYYGRDLRDYIARACDRSDKWEPIGQVRRIRFWGDVIERWWRRPAEPGAAADGGDM